MLWALVQYRLELKCCLLLNYVFFKKDKEKGCKLLQASWMTKVCLQGVTETLCSILGPFEPSIPFHIEAFERA